MIIGNNLQKNSKYSITNNKGFTLIGLLIGLSVNGILALGTMQLHNYFTQTVQKNNLLVTKQQLINEIDMIPHFSGTHIQDNMESNIQLKNCIRDAGICREDPITDFTLDLSGGVNIINGTTGVFYSEKGVPCSSWSVNCPFKIIAIINPICPTNSSITCKKAEGFLFNFNIEIHSNAKEKFNLTDVLDRNIYIHHSIFEKDRNIMVSQQCPSGEIVLSVNIDGTINCEPQPETIRKHITYVSTVHSSTGGGDGDGDGGGGSSGGSGSGNSSGSCP